MATSAGAAAADSATTEMAWILRPRSMAIAFGAICHGHGARHGAGGTRPSSLRALLRERSQPFTWHPGTACVKYADGADDDEDYYLAI